MTGHFTSYKTRPNHELATACRAGLALWRGITKSAAVWNEPYLESCCRSALHRLQLSGSAGRPPDLPDGACLRRIASMGLCDYRADGRFAINAAGRLRHRTEILKQRTATTVVP